ncbi:MAG: hypothetical protein ACR2MS_03410 [Weeksellaceae bacterium]
MKKFIYTITALVAFTLSVNAQVGIETEDVSDKAILDFPDNANGGILLPYVADPSTAGTESGTLLYNATEGAVYVNDNTATWVPLTETPVDASNIATHDVSTYPELNSEGVVISNINAAPSATGVLVLDSNDRALALPKVAGVENIQSPKAGMICYDTTRKALAIFNGENWILRN